MSDETSRSSNGRRWYDPNKIVWGLFAIVGTLASVIFVAAYFMLAGGINENRVDLKRVGEAVIKQSTMQEVIVDRLDDIDRKLDDQ